MEPLVLDKDALEKLGLHSEALYALEYDLPSNYLQKIDKKTKQFLEFMRWKMVYQLKYKLRAIRNLNSSWFIDGERLNDAEEFVESMKQQYASKGFNMDKKIRIIPILTTTEGFQSYEDKKAEFLLEFLHESLEKVEKGLSDEIMSEPILWRCKKSVEIVESIKETLQYHAEYKLINDTISMLTDKIQIYENLKINKKEAKKKQKKAK